MIRKVRFFNALILLIIFCFSFGSIAVEAKTTNHSLNDGKSLVSKNEFIELFQPFKKEGLESKAEIQSLETLKEQYIKDLYRKKDFSILRLKEMNYSDEQIYAIKNFDGSDSMAAKASAYVNISARTITNSDSTHGVSFTWEWVGTPFLCGPGITDGVAVRWKSYNKDGIGVDSDYGSQSSAYVAYGNKISYKRINHDNTSKHAQTKFIMTGEDENGKAGVALRGAMNIYASVPKGVATKLVHSDFYFVYGHATLTATSVSFSFPSSLGISVSRGIVQSSKNWGVYK